MGAHGACRRSFSLVEVLAVLVVASILTVVAFPALDAARQATSVDDGIRGVGSQVQYARQAALTGRRYIALIMPAAAAEEAGIASATCYRCHRLAIVTKELVFDRWVPDQKWSYIRNGAAIMEADDDVGISRDGEAADRLPLDNNMVTIDDVDLTAIGGPAAADGIRAVVFNPAGKLVGSARFITVGAASKIDGTWTLVDPVPAGEDSHNASCTNQITIHINRYTGGVRYMRPDQYPAYGS